jgi:iron-sulfur cluster assembly protein
MNSEITINEPQLKPVTLTPKALAHLQKIIRLQGKGLGLRLEVKKAGCSGYGYDVAIAEQESDGDYAFPLSEQLAVYISRKSYPFVQGTCIDLVTQGLNSNFVFHNPNAGVSCGCGESFGIAEE